MTTATTPMVTQRTLHELRTHDGPLFIANNTLNPVHCHERVGNESIDFELEPKGHPESVMELPKAALSVRGLQKLILRGDLIIGTDPEMVDQITLLVQSSPSTEQKIAEIMAFSGDGATAEVSTPAESVSITVKACLVCGKTDENGVIERGRVHQTPKEVREGVPPLCDDHRHLSFQFAPRSVIDPETKEQRWEFDRATITTPVRETDTTH